MHPEKLQKKADAAEGQQELLRKQVAELRQEIEDLSYAISHDLRAPLRAVHGFAGALREDCEEQLDAQGQRYLSIITTSTHQMSRMIEGILTLSRLGSQPMRPSEVPMQQLVEQLVSDFKKTFPDRQINFQIGQLPNACGDLVLLQQVWSHLLINAVKFTRPKENADIEIGSSSEAGEVVYYVRDNGVGFDMKYESKLFGLFQRFHTEKEFEGTGVGLAVVRRLVRRHDGRVWAQAEVDSGATFYFALPKG
ncbi:MAG: two-component sensor histidine kinase [Verrucomicrobia bacterium]|nr:two-component sensor histidine kinase [Verrucomicrobiota bacterium]